MFDRDSVKWLDDKSPFDALHRVPNLSWPKTYIPLKTRQLRMDNPLGLFGLTSRPLSG